MSLKREPLHTLEDNYEVKQPKLSPSMNTPASHDTKEVFLFWESSDDGMGNDGGEPSTASTTAFKENALPSPTECDTSKELTPRPNTSKSTTAGPGKPFHLPNLLSIEAIRDIEISYSDDYLLVFWPESDAQGRVMEEPQPRGDTASLHAVDQRDELDGSDSN